MSSASKVLAVVTIITVTVVIGQIAVAVDSVDEEYFEAADAYCEQELGPEAELVNSQVIGDHGGLHCEGPDDEFIHLHDIPDAEIYAALPE